MGPLALGTPKMPAFLNFGAVHTIHGYLPMPKSNTTWLHVFVAFDEALLWLFDGIVVAATRVLRLPARDSKQLLSASTEFGIGRGQVEGLTS